MEWRPIPGFERYSVSADGRVRNSAGRELARRISWRGYPEASLWADGKSKIFRIHRLVALAFIPNPHNYPQVNHIDRDKQNNRVENLEWIDNLSNHRHSADAFLVCKNPKRAAAAKLSVDDVSKIREQLRAGVSAHRLAREWNVSHVTIYRINANKARQFEPSAEAHVYTNARTDYPRHRPKHARNAAVFAMRESGKTYAEIAAHYGKSTSWVGNVLLLYRQQLAQQRDWIKPVEAELINEGEPMCSDKESGE